MVAPEHRRCALHVAASERTANRSAAHGFVDTVGARDESQRNDFEIMLRRHLTQERHAAAAFVAEVEVFAHDHTAHRERIDQYASHEVGGGFRRRGSIERHHERGVDTG